MRSFFIATAAFCTTLGIFSEISSEVWITHANQITEDWLINAGGKTGYTEHVRHFKRLFNKMNVKGFLEFGVGFSTKYFLDHSENVISVEFVTPGSGPDWLKDCIKLYEGYSNWTPVAYFSGQGLDTSWAPYKFIGDESVYKAAAYQPVHLKSYAEIDPSFLEELNHFIEQQTIEKEIDVAFVDAGICIRGDLVQLLFNKVPIIVAHDIARKGTRHFQDVYGYGRVTMPDNYIEIHVPFGMGTAFWIKNEEKYQEIIQDLKDYVKGK